MNTKVFGKKLNFLNKKKYDQIKFSQKNAFIKALKERNIPLKEIIVKKFEESTIGELFFLFIFETLVLSKMLKNNPFDQPAVERVKILTRKLLFSKKFAKNY